jgi:hypothetical protein
MAVFCENVGGDETWGRSEGHGVGIWNELPCPVSFRDGEYLDIQLGKGSRDVWLL